MKVLSASCIWLTIIIINAFISLSESSESSASLYDVLGLEPSATTQEIRKTFKVSEFKKIKTLEVVKKHILSETKMITN